MTRPFQSNPFVEFGSAILRENERARIRALNPISPRCANCGGTFVGDVDAVIAFARLDDIDLPGFDPADLICGHCWFEIWGDRGGTA